MVDTLKGSKRRVFMEFTDKKYHRRSVRLAGFDYSQNGAYFVTICTYKRQLLFGDIIQGEMNLNQFGLIVDEYWRLIPTHFSNVAADLNAWVVMPNHIHGIVVIDDGARHASPVHKPATLGVIIGSFKSAVARKINILRRTPGAPAGSGILRTIIRDETEWKTILKLYRNQSFALVRRSRKRVRATHASPYMIIENQGMNASPIRNDVKSRQFILTVHTIRRPFMSQSTGSRWFRDEHNRYLLFHGGTWAAAVKCPSPQMAPLITGEILRSSRCILHRGPFPLAEADEHFSRCAPGGSPSCAS
jgi:REP element-mobilizing transposase RayT